MKKAFSIVTSINVGMQIDKLRKSEDFIKHRTFTIPTVSYADNYSVVYIEAKEDRISPEDIFWLGYFSAFEQTK